MATSIGVKLKMDGESEFRRGLQNIVSETKSLDKQLGALESSFDGEKKSLEENQKQTDLLEKKKAALEKQIEETSKALEYAKNNYEEGSKEISSWEGALADAEKELNQTNAKIEENADFLEQSTSAYGQLTAEIESQTAELESLRDAYIDAVLEYGEGSDQAQELAGQISTLSSELNENQQKLDAAAASADGLTQSLDNTEQAESDMGDMAVSMGSIFNSQISSMASAMASGGIAGAFVAIAEAVKEAAEEIINLKSEWEAGMSTIQIATGYAEEELEEFTLAAREASAAIVGFDTQSASEAVGTLATRLGLTADDTELVTEKVGELYKILGVDSTSAVNGAADAMYQWGLVTGDSAKDTQTFLDILDMLVVAQQNAPVSVEELTNTLSSQAVAYQALGLDMESTVSMIDSYVNRGGNMNDITMAAYNIFKNLNGEVEDLPATFLEIIDTVSNSNDQFATMSETVGETGKTIEDVLGAKKAGAIINTFSRAGASIDEFDESLRNVTGTLDMLYEDSITASEQLEYIASGKWSDNNFNKYMKEAQKDTSDFRTVIDNTSMSVDGLSGKIMDNKVGLKTFNGEIEGGHVTWNKWSGMIETVTDDATGATYAFDKFGKLVSITENGVTRNVRNIEDEFESLHDTAYAELTTPIPMHISAPSIGYSQTGTGGNTKITPYYGGRYTFAKAYEQAMILTAPTVFGASGNNLLVGGDRPGNEIIVGEQHLLEMIGKASGGNNIVVNVYGAEGQDVSALADIVADRIQMRIERTAAVYA